MPDASDRRQKALRVEEELRAIRYSAQTYAEDALRCPSLAIKQAAGNYQGIIERCNEALRAGGTTMADSPDRSGVRLTDNQLRELRIIGKTRRGEYIPRIADDLRAAKALERKGLVKLVRERTERHPAMGKGPDYVVRVYMLTDSGRAALAAYREASR